MERFQLIRKMYLQGTISLAAAIILAVTDEERQELRDLAGLLEHFEDCEHEKACETEQMWDSYHNIYDHYCDECYALDCIYEMSRTSGKSDYCDISRFMACELYTDYCEDIANDFDYAAIVSTLHKKTGIMTMLEYTAYRNFCTHRKEREIAEEWVNGNIVSVPSGLDLTYITSHYHSLLPYRHH